MSLLPVSVTQTIARSTLLTQKNSPTILFASGIAGMIGSTVLACRATLKMDEVLDEAKTRMATARSMDHPEYSRTDRERDLTLVRFQTGVQIFKLYTPAIVVGGISIAALTKSHNILTTRNAALTAAYAALDKGFKEYRARVIDKYGEDEDRKLRFGTRTIVAEDEDGEKREITRVAPGDPSGYARFFDASSRSWNPDPEYNLLFLKSNQNWANDLLRSRGHVFLNEVYDMLGLERSKAGSVVGWILKKDGSTDNHIDFGVFNGSQPSRDFVNGFEGAILLDFNVDGLIWDQIEKAIEEY